MLIQIAQGTWIFITSDSSMRLVGLILDIVSGIILLALVYLAVFHCYITFCEYGTTLRYLRGSSRVDESKNEHKVTSNKFIKDLLVFGR